MSGYVDEITAIEHAVARALSDAGVKDDSTVKAVLVHDAEMHDGTIIVCDPDGKSVSITQRLSQMKNDPRFRDDFPKASAPPNRPPAATPAGAILAPDRSQFEAISSGKAVVR